MSSKVVLVALGIEFVEPGVKPEAVERYHWYVSGATPPVPGDTDTVTLKGVAASATCDNEPAVIVIVFSPL